MKLRSALLLIISCAVLLSAQVPEVEITAEPHHHLALQNPFVRVFKVELAPQAATLMHRHRHDYVFVTLGPSEVENDVQGKPSATLKLKDGDTYFLPGGFAHIAKNLSGQPFRNVTIEFMQDEKARKSPPPKWDEAHLLVAVSDLEIRSDVVGQGPMPGHFKSGDVKWLPGGYSHTVTNVGKSEAKFITLEFH